MAWRDGTAGWHAELSTPSTASTGSSYSVNVTRCNALVTPSQRGVSRGNACNAHQIQIQIQSKEQQPRAYTRARARDTGRWGSCWLLLPDDVLIER